MRGGEIEFSQWRIYDSIKGATRFAGHWYLHKRESHHVFLFWNGRKKTLPMNGHGPILPKYPRQLSLYSPKYCEYFHIFNLSVIDFSRKLVFVSCKQFIFMKTTFGSSLNHRLTESSSLMPCGYREPFPQTVDNIRSHCILWVHCMKIFTCWKIVVHCSSARIHPT